MPTQYSRATLAYEVVVWGGGNPGERVRSAPV
jgi:hypothetical protein